MEIPKSWIANKKILTAEKVRRLEPGAQIWIHTCYGRRGEHLTARATIVQSGKKKLLRISDWRGNFEYREIKTQANTAYTLD